MRQVLQSAIVLLQSATGITKCDGYYKVRRNKLPEKVRPDEPTRAQTKAEELLVSFTAVIRVVT